MNNEKTIILEELIKSLGMEENVIEMSEEQKEAIICSIEEDVEQYRISNYKKIITSQEEISTFVLTS